LDILCTLRHGGTLADLALKGLLPVKQPKIAAVVSLIENQYAGTDRHFKPSDWKIPNRQ